MQSMHMSSHTPSLNFSLRLAVAITSYQFALESSQVEAILMPTGTLKLDAALKA